MRGSVKAGGLLAVLLVVSCAESIEVSGAVSLEEEQSIGERDGQLELPPAPPVLSVGYHQPPSRGEWPEGELGEAVRRGAALFRETGKHAPEYVGNGMSCANCHLDNGRRPNSAPMWAAWVTYPAYRKKNNAINSLEDRLRGCFRYSLNAPASPRGTPPPSGSPILGDLSAYLYWLAKGLPTGIMPPGRGYPKIQKTQRGYSPREGAVVYRSQCAICHGDNGRGLQNKDGWAFPPLWGEDSYNWGAGMHRVNTAAAFIKSNMPLGKGGSLTDQEAWDVAAFINHQERPGDPRIEAGTEVPDSSYHNHQCYYGEEL